MRLLIFGLFWLLVLGSGCVSNRKIALLKESIKKQEMLESRLDSTLQILNDLRSEKNTKGELDDTTSVALKKALDKRIDATDQRQEEKVTMLQKIAERRIRRKDYKNMIIIVSKGNKIISQNLETVDFIDQLLKQTTFIKFNTAAFFPPGAYKIPADKFIEAKAAFSPIIDSLINFLLRFPQKELEANVISTGYADGQGFAPGDLFNTLSNFIGKDNPEKEELNEELSKLRADDVAEILKQIFFDKVGMMPALTKQETKFFMVGKGEDYPNKKIKDYEVNDERRRIVVLYWSALPKNF